jgi:hypothetical protein
MAKHHLSGFEPLSGDVAALQCCIAREDRNVLAKGAHEVRDIVLSMVEGRVMELVVCSGCAFGLKCESALHTSRS